MHEYMFSLYGFVHHLFWFVFIVCFCLFFSEMEDLFKMTSEHSFNTNQSVPITRMIKKKKNWNCEISSAGIPLVAGEAILIDITCVLGEEGGLD